MHPLAPVLCSTLPGAVCAAAHYIPWRHWFRDGKLPRLLSYGVGLLTILLPVTVAAWLAAVTPADVLALLWLAACSAGAGTAVPWWYDWQRKNAERLQDEADRTWTYGE